MWMWVWEKWSLCVLFSETEIGRTSAINSMKFPKEIKTGLPFNLGIPLLGIYSKEIKSPI